MVTFVLASIATVGFLMFLLWLAYQAIVFLLNAVSELVNMMFSVGVVLFIVGFILGAILL